MLDPLLGQVVVLDLDSDYLVFGTLASAAADHLVLTDADLHDHREANATKEAYAVETRRLGVRANRARVVVPRQRLVAISLLSEVVG